MKRNPISLNNEPSSSFWESLVKISLIVVESPAKDWNIANSPASVPSAYRWAVKKGATTIWETWDGIDKDGVPKGSLNHYSYGAVIGWLLNGVCGIKYSDRETVIKPIPNRIIGHAAAEYSSPKGIIKSGWRYEGEKCIISVEIPCNMRAKVIMPNGREYIIGPGKRNFEIRGQSF